MAIVENGVIVLDMEAILPEGTRSRNCSARRGSRGIGCPGDGNVRNLEGSNRSPGRFRGSGN